MVAFDLKNGDAGASTLDNPLAAVQMGLIYVNPEGPNGKPDPAASARDIRETFGRMAMNDYETVALTAGGHTFGKMHGAGNPDHVGPEPEGRADRGTGSRLAQRPTRPARVRDTITSGWRAPGHPTRSSGTMGYFDVLFKYEWEFVKSPAGAWQWTPKELKPKRTWRPMRRRRHPRAKPIFMSTADMAMRMDPDLRKDLEALPRESRTNRRCLRAGLVQAAAPRHGAEGRAISARKSRAGGPDLAGPDPGGRSR